MKKNTKQSILKAARELFVQHGFAGASMGDVSKLAKVNHSLIFHHFTNKEQLWLAVKQDIVKEADKQNKVLPSINLSFQSFLKALIKQGVDFYRNNPDIIRMINWQRLEGSSTQKIGVTLSSETKAWIDAFKHYQKLGEINSELQPKFIVTLILSVISSAALDPNVFINKKNSLEAYISFCVERLERALL